MLVVGNQKRIARLLCHSLRIQIDLDHTASAMLSYSHDDTAPDGSTPRSAARKLYQIARLIGVCVPQKRLDPVESRSRNHHVPTEFDGHIGQILQHPVFFRRSSPSLFRNCVLTRLKKMRT